jgi:hypothetical protein
MKIFVATLALCVAFVVVAADKPDKPDKQEMVKTIANKYATFPGTVEEMKADIASNIKSDPGTYTVADVKEFLDAICAEWKSKVMKCDDFRTFAMEKKKEFGKIKE